VMTDAVTFEVMAGVADVRLNRPEKHNAVDGDIIDGLLAAIERVRSDQSIRCVVLSGEGKSFCAGLDMSSFADMISGDLTADSASDAYDEVDEAGANRVQRLGWGWQQLEIPVIAAIHGAAMGGGLNIAMGADIRVVAPTAKLGFVEITYGLLPDMSATQSLRHVVRLDRMKELVLSGRRFNGEEAYEYGLATMLSESPLETAMEIARSMASRNPDAVRAGKRLLNEAMFNTTAEGLLAESNCSRQLIGTPNQIEAVVATLEAREPSFTDGG
jgi:enoyl-CoA hydratase/carnithine racemase